MTDQSIREGDSRRSNEEGKSGGSFKSFRVNEQNTRFTFAGEQQMSESDIRIVRYSDFNTLNDRKHQIQHLIQLEGTSLGNRSEAMHVMNQSQEFEANRVDLIRDEEEEGGS